MCEGGYINTYTSKRGGSPYGFKVRINMPVNFSLEVEVIEPMGADTLVWSQIGGQEFRFIIDGNISVNVGDRVTVGFDPAHVSIFDFDNEERL